MPEVHACKVLVKDGCFKERRLSSFEHNLLREMSPGPGSRHAEHGVYNSFVLLEIV